uniref:Uncharacterized protein n=1 Tax=Oryza barthii TaxID=65489 RepID=A0A0D3H0A3_9ORYZ
MAAAAATAASPGRLRRLMGAATDAVLFTSLCAMWVTNAGSVASILARSGGGSWRQELLRGRLLRPPPGLRPHVRVARGELEEVSALYAREENHFCFYPGQVVYVRFVGSVDLYEVV